MSEVRYCLQECPNALGLIKRSREKDALLAEMVKQLLSSDCHFSCADIEGCVSSGDCDCGAADTLAKYEAQK